MKTSLRLLRNLTLQTGDSNSTGQGGYHSSPYGWWPNAAYLETQYGPNFDEEADWNDLTYFTPSALIIAGPSLAPPGRLAGPCWERRQREIRIQRAVAHDSGLVIHLRLETAYRELFQQACSLWFRFSESELEDQNYPDPCRIQPIKGACSLVRCRQVLSYRQSVVSYALGGALLHFLAPFDTGRHYFGLRGRNP